MTISGFNKCANCGACYNACPEEAITVDTKGMFYKPLVNSEKCIDCGICEKICPVNHALENNTHPICAYAGWSNHDDVVMGSSSGGAFWGLAQNVISDGGVVFGACYSDNFNEVMFFSSDEKPLSVMRKSKYVESLVGKSFIKVKEELNKGRRVLFCGTPCQVAGLKAFLKRDDDFLITCDFVCGGLPSHKIYQDYLLSIEKSYGSKIKNVDFRPKTHGWKRYAFLVETENGKVYNRLGTEDPYLKSFLYGKYTVRNYCLECEFSDRHASDITLADFWLHDKFSDLRNENGISLIFCNNEKSKEIVKNLEKDYVLQEVTLENALYNHKKTSVSDDMIKKHNAFLVLYEQKGLIFATKRYLPSSLKSKVKNRIARFVFRKKRGKN